MDERPLGGSGVAITRIVLGCGNFGGIGSSPAFFGQGTSRPDAFRLMDTAWDAGITTFDTADAYGGGRSETFIGEWLATKGTDVRDRIVIATKTYNPMDEGDDHGLGRARIRRQIETSLRRLGVERVGALSRARLRPGHAAGGDAGGVRRPRSGGQGRRDRCVELHRRAARGGARARRARAPTALRVGAERLLAPRSGRPRDRLPRLPRARSRLHARSARSRAAG